MRLRILPAPVIVGSLEVDDGIETGVLGALLHCRVFAVLQRFRGQARRFLVIACNGGIRCGVVHLGEVLRQIDTAVSVRLMHRGEAMAVPERRQSRSDIRVDRFVTDVGRRFSGLAVDEHR